MVPISKFPQNVAMDSHAQQALIWTTLLDVLPGEVERHQSSRRLMLNGNTTGVGKGCVCGHASENAKIGYP